MRTIRGGPKSQPFTTSALVLGLAMGCGSGFVSNSAYCSDVVQEITAPSIAVVDQDCTSLGDVAAREACFANQSDEAIAQCERVRRHACMPYKEMHVLERERINLNQDVLAEARRRYGSYTEDDAAYLDDIAVYLKDSEAAWVAYRDADCLLEPFAQGTSRQQASDLTEACRVERTKARIAQLKALFAQ